MVAKNAVLSLVSVALTGFACASPGGSSSEEKVDPQSVHQPRGAQMQAATAEPAMARSNRGFVTDIEKRTKQNEDFRHVVYTAKHSQLVVMALPPGEHIGAETHPDIDQFFRVEQGTGEVMIGGNRTPIHPGSAVVIPAGTKHDVTATGDKPLKLYSIYSPPQHRDGVVHHTRADAENDDEHFDGTTTD